jgi:hypothetical protein
MWLEIIVSILIFLVMLFVAIFKIKNAKNLEKIDILPNCAFVLNPCRRQFANGSCLGAKIGEIQNKNGTTTIKFLPLDNIQGKDEKLLPPQEVVVANENIKRIPSGKLSPREFIFLVGRSALDYPEEIRPTPIGEWMTEKGQEAWLEKTMGKMIPAGDEAVSNQMSKFARGHIDPNTLNQITEANKFFLAMQSQKKDNGLGEQQH